jgi:hypothetical protein
MFQDNLSGIARLLQGLHETTGGINPDADPTPVQPSGPASPLAALLHTAQGAQAPQTPDSPAPQHHGMFGIHGALRDILGTLGDAFLVQSGNKPVYSAQREQEKEGDAMRDFVANPMQAVQRLAAENPELAAKIHNELTRNTAYSSNLQADNDVKTMGIVGSLLRTATPQNWEGIKSTIGKISAARGYQLPFDLPEQFDPDFVEQNKYFGAQPTAALTDERRGESISERRDYHGRTADAADTRNDIYQTDVNGRISHYRRVDDQGDARVEQGATRTRNDTARTEQGAARVKQGDRRLDQTQEANDMRGQGVYSGRHKPIPGAITHNPTTGQVGYKHPDGTIVDITGKHVLGRWK